MTDFVIYLSVGFSVSVVVGLAAAMVFPSFRPGAGLMSLGTGRTMAAGLIVAAGPFLLARELVRSGVRAEWPMRYLFGGAVICAVWSVVTGFLVCACLPG
jgi:hypothetical protein